VPSLFTFNMPAHPITKLMGISMGKVRVKINGTRLDETGPLLITHWGLSGPVILRLSAWGARELAEKNWKFGIRVNWLPKLNEQEMMEKFKQLRSSLGSHKLFHKNPFDLPQRFWEFLLERSGIGADTRWADLSSTGQNKLVKKLSSFDAEINGKTTFKEEFVTAGGVLLQEIDPQTMQSKLVPHLFFAGEIMNVDGITGGFNFQHAWTSGFIAAKTITSLL
jgi:predicted Rossmann fold flavoprotein